MAVTIKECEGSPSLKMSSGKISATRKVLIDWADYPAFWAELFGAFKVTAGVVTAEPGATYPGITNLIPKDLSVDPYPPTKILSGATTIAAVNTYSQALCTISYEPIDPTDPNNPDHPDETILTVERDIGAEYLTAPGRSWKWSVDDAMVPEDLNAGVLIATEDFQMTWSRVVSPPYTAIRRCRGRLNNATFMGYPAGLVLFMGAKETIEYHLEGDPTFRLVYHFKAKALLSTADSTTLYGWNRFWRPDAVANENWQPIVANDAGEAPPYPEENFDDLFQYES